MELFLERLYFSKGTNGRLWYGEQLICHTIELPWLQNEKQISCIPIGKYRLLKRFHKKFGCHLWVSNVPNRQYILIHPANNAQKELLGCIAPVMVLEGEGIGGQSRVAVKKLQGLVFPVLDSGEEVFLNVR